jgi:sugar phosphate isomerase/epimerase
MTGIELSLGLAGLEAAADVAGADGAGDRLRAQLGLARRLGVRWVQLDGTAPGMRARELGRSARRDLAGVLRRGGVGPSGVDLWVPPEHFVSPAHADRAITAALEAIGLAGELARQSAAPRGAVVSLMLPLADEPGAEPAAEVGAVRAALAERAEREGVTVADHAWVPGESAQARGSRFMGRLAAGLDPAGVLMAGGEPLAAAASLGHLLASARLSDVTAAGRRAVGPGGAGRSRGAGAGGGRLDVAAYAVTLGVVGFVGPVVLDLRDVPDQAEAAARAAEAWSAASAAPAVGGGAFKLGPR